MSSSTAACHPMEPGPALPSTTQGCQPRGNLARLVSRFEVGNAKHASAGDAGSGSDIFQPRASRSSSASKAADDAWEKRSLCPSTLEARGTFYDGATEAQFLISLSRTSSCRWSSHLLTNHEDDDNEERLKSQKISPARALISRQKSVAERREAFESRKGRPKCKFVQCLWIGFCNWTSAVGVKVSRTDLRLVPDEVQKHASKTADEVSLAHMPESTVIQDASQPQPREVPVVDDLSQSESPSSESSISAQEERMPMIDPQMEANAGSTTRNESEIGFIADDCQNPQLGVAVNKMSDERQEEAVALKQAKEKGAPAYQTPNPEILQDEKLEDLSLKTTTHAAMPTKDLSKTKEAHPTPDPPRKDIYASSPLKPVSPYTPREQTAPRVSPLNLLGKKPLHDSTNRSLKTAEKGKPFQKGRNLVDDQTRASTLPYFWERARDTLLEQPDNPRVLQKSRIPKSDTAGKIATLQPRKASITTSKTCGPGYLTGVSRAWTTKQNPSPLKDRIGLFKALSRNDKEVPLTENAKQRHPGAGEWRQSLGKQTASRVKEALRIFSLSKDRRRGCVSDNDGTNQSDRVETKTWRASRLFRSEALAQAPASDFTGNIDGSREHDNGAPGLQAVMSGHTVLHHNTPISHKDGKDGKATSPHESRSKERASPIGLGGRYQRWRNHNEGPTISSAHCKLEQPKPVRAGDMKRLVSLCKHKVSWHRVWGESEGVKAIR